MEHLYTYLRDQFNAGAKEVRITREEDQKPGDGTIFYVEPKIDDTVEREKRKLRLQYQKGGFAWVD